MPSRRELQNEFRRFSSEAQPKTYSYKLTGNGQHLYFFGSTHSNDVKDVQFTEIETFWDDFIKSTPLEHRLLLTEGGVRDASHYESEENAICAGGEMGFITYLASQEDIPIVTPEPTDQEWFEGLSKHFSKEEVAYYDFARVAYQWNRSKSTVNFSDYIAPFLEQNRRTLEWNFFSLPELKKIHTKLFDIEFKERDVDFLRSILDPSADTSIINKISRFDDSGFRDSFVYKNIKNYWEKGHSMFIIYGLQHAKILEPFLREMVGAAQPSL